MTLRRSNGAVDVRDTAPAKAPANKCLHHLPVSISVCVKSSGTFKSSPMSRYYLYKGQKKKGETYN